MPPWNRAESAISEGVDSSVADDDGNDDATGGGWSDAQETALRACQESVRMKGVTPHSDATSQRL